MDNIFPTGRPAGPADVVDREEFIREAVERLMMGHDIMLAGPRRIGKSSVAGEILRQLQERRAYTAGVDVFRTATVEAFATRLLEAIVANRTGLIAKAARNIKELGKYLGQARVSAKLHDLELGVALVEQRPSPEDLLELALVTAEKIAEHDGRLMAIVIDEFQDISKMGNTELLKRMRSTIQQQQHTVYLFMGSQTHLMTDLFAKSDAAFFRFAIQMYLPSIPWSEWEQYIIERLQTKAMTIRDTALQVVREKTGGHPHGVMVVMDAALLHAKLGGKTIIEADDALYGYSTAMEGTLGAIYTQEWAAVREYKHAARVLWTIAEGGEPYAGASSRSSVTDAIKLLESRGLIRSEGRGHHQFIEPMFGAWLRQQAGQI